MKALVVPSNRPDSLAAWFSAWRGVADWDVLIVVEDAPRPSGVDIPGAVRVAWCDIDRHPLRKIISRKDAGIRSFGYLLAAEMGARYVGTMDDDCYPERGGWFNSHLAAMRVSRWVSPAGIPARGFPFRNRGQGAAVLNMGLWSKVADWSAVHQLAQPPANFSPPRVSAIVPAGQYFPCSGMNLIFHADLLPLMLHPKQGEGEAFRRFDDIWAGIIAKRVLDACGYWVTAGRPSVRHERASDALENLVAEAPGIKKHESFWELIEGVEIATPQRGMLRAKRIRTAAAELARGMLESGDDYTARVGANMLAWQGDTTKLG